MRVRILSRASVQPVIVSIVVPGGAPQVPRSVVIVGLKLHTPPIAPRSSLPAMPVPATSGQEMLFMITPERPQKLTCVGGAAPPVGMVTGGDRETTPKPREAECISPLASCACTVTV